ncbi:MAG: hypothetical protein AB7P76_05325 [Candidatus Melainabacteria bacterium]
MKKVLTPVILLAIIGLLVYMANTTNRPFNIRHNSLEEGVISLPAVQEDLEAAGDHLKSATGALGEATEDAVEETKEAFTDLKPMKPMTEAEKTALIDASPNLGQDFKILEKVPEKHGAFRVQQISNGKEFLVISTIEANTKKTTVYEKDGATEVRHFSTTIQ